MKELLIRFIIGGTVVSCFAVIGDVLRPKSFAGLFGAAPSVALATLGLTVAANGKWFAATEARSMIVGAIAFFVYAEVTSWILMRKRMHTLTITVALLPVWFGCAFGLWILLLRHAT
jgi:hypothetical protein